MKYLSDASFLRVNNGIVVATTVVAHADRSVAGAVSPMEDVNGNGPLLRHVNLDRPVEQLTSSLHFRIVSVHSILLLTAHVAIK